MLALAAPRRPRLPQLFFLILAAFLMTSKVWSPQYVIWLTPLVVLARPRLWSYALWQAAEIGYFFAIWAYLITQVGDSGGSAPTCTSPPCWPGSARCCCSAAWWSRTSCGRTRTWSGRTAPTTPRAACSTGAPDRFTLRLRLRRMIELEEA